MQPDARRLERLLTHVRAGWRSVRSSEAARQQVERWLEEHPAGWQVVQDAWLAASRFEGPLPAWLDAGAKPDDYDLDVPLHSILSSHPFAALPRWSNPPTSTAS